MKINKKIFACLILSIFLLSTLSVAFAEDDDKEYSISQALLDLTVQNNGMLHIQETYHYIFSGTYNGVYRDIPLKSGESIENLNITTDGAYNKYTITNESGTEHIKIYLYSDAAKTEPISDTDVDVHINYDFKNVVTIYKDTALLQYKLWGDQWDVDVGQVITTIHLPSNTGNQYWLNPPQFNQTSSMTGNTIQSTTTSIPSGDFFELQVTMPLKDFSNAVNAKHENRNGLNEIMKTQEDYKSSTEFYNNLFLIIGILCCISPLAPIGVYLKYGREPKINYNGIYERELPTKDPPAMINALIENSSNIGTPDMKGFEATIMDLIDRKILKLTVENTDKPDKKNLYLTVNNDKADNLDTHEKDIINIFKTFSDDNGTLSLNDFQDTLSNRENGEWFKEKYELWQEDFAFQYLNEDKLKKIFINTGSTIFTFIGIGGIILSIFIAAMALLSTIPTATYSLVGAIIIFITSIICLILPDDVGGRWTENGKEFHDKWKNFKKFLNDNSLMKEHPPESIEIWNQYLVYAAALGVADKVHKVMKMEYYDNSSYDPYYNDTYMFHSYGGFLLMDSAFNTGMSTANATDSDGGFDIGGGSGGGGGGAF
ncbi:DUF2207 domain-containing protein [Methanobrevibacter sp. UBA417]|jgi:uncharacterized membrane protein|uniref:DUF2207 domain-containing protein n=1 Tax=Methanobrevibacter sp. UBA417 TaxID=1915487 RepID=UPI0039B8F9B0